MNASPLDQLMTTPQLASFLGVPVSTLRKWRREGTGPRAFKVGRHLRYRRADVEVWLERRADAPEVAA